MTRAELKLEDAHMVLTGKVNGREVKFEGDVKGLYPHFGVDDEYYENTNLDFHDAQRYFLEFQGDSEGKYGTISRQMLDVEHVVTMYHEAPTAKLIAQFAEAAGVPEDASIRINNGLPKEITFTWTEKK